MKTTRREFAIGSAALALSSPWSKRSVAGEPSHDVELWFSKPAERWMEALPVGNGRIGGMVYGEVCTERIDLTESTVWSGAPSDGDVNPAARQALPRIRELLFAGKYVEAIPLCEQTLLGRPKSFGTHLPLASLEIKLAETKVGGYRRSLRLDDAIARVEYSAGDVTYRREIFSSNPDDVLVAHYSCGELRGMNLSVGFAELNLPGTVVVEGHDTLVLRGDAFEHLHSNGKQGVAFEVRVRVIAEEGRVVARSSSVDVSGTTNVTLHVAIATNFRGVDPAARCAKKMNDLRSKTYEQLRSEHVADHRSLFGRVSLELERSGDATAKPTDERREAIQAGGLDPDFAALFFQYGRYLTIAGSRANSPLPLALQGIWNDGLASSMGWTDDFHLDINTQQNYWAAELGNLAECQTPLFDFIEGLRIAGQTTAREMYGAPGWVAHVVTNPWGYTAPGWGLGWGLFPTGGVWLALQMWEHYRFTGDEQFLRQRLYPVYKQAGEFFLSYMVKHPRLGWLVTGPSDSPENSFIAPDGRHCSESMGPTCDRVLVYALLSACIETSSLLQVDDLFREKAQKALAQLAPLQIGKHGQVQEWLEDFEEAEPGHRHTSHLIALYPEHQISPATTPALAKAARVTIERRINQPNWEDSEWSRANLVNYYARLLDGEAAHKQLVGLFSHATEASLLTYSRGGVAGAQSNIFSLDGNTAGAAGIAEMLLQSQAGEIHLLPALPSAWKRGSVRGLCARGGAEVAMSWVDGRLSSFTLKSKRGGTYVVRYGEHTVQCTLPVGREIKMNTSRFHSV